MNRNDDSGRRVRFGALAALILALVIPMTGAVFAPDSIHAQGNDNEYVDVALILEVPDDIQANLSHQLNIIVVNHGSRAAYDVVVVVDVVSPDKSTFGYTGLPEVPVGSASLVGTSLHWTIPALGGLQREEVNADVTHEGADAPTFDNTLDPHELSGEVTTSSYDSNLSNNTYRVWSYDYTALDGSFRQVLGNYSVGVSVDNASPSPGDTVNFTIEADRANPYSATRRGTDAVPPPIDLKVDIELTDGLTVTGTPSYAPTTNRAASVSYSNGVFTIGTLQQGKSRTNSVTLPITVANGAVVNEQCLTATLTGNPPPGTGRYDDDISDNVARLCLGEQPVKVFDDGVVRTSTLYACKEGVPDNGCDTAAEVHVRIIATTTEDEVLNNATALIHVKDVPGRVFDANSGSVTDGTTVSWQTATDLDPDFTGTRNGVTVGWYRAPVNDYINNWQHFNATYRASGLNGGVPPGLVSVRSTFSGNAFFELTADNSYQFKRSTDYSLSSTSTAFTRRMMEFQTLGTYVLDFTADVLHATIDDDGVSGPDTFSGTGRTIYHVGPIAELGVSDGGPSGDATADQVAFTVAGFNDAGGTYESGKIVVELPAGATGLTTVPASTGVFDGNASPPTWTWDIHNLDQTGGRRISSGLSAGIIVTLIVEGVSAGETASAKVVYDPYEVCVASDGTTASATDQTTCEGISGASWHSGTVFDTNDDNDTATLTARAGGNAPGTPTLETPVVHAPAVGVRWSEVEFLYGVPVKEYQVQWSTDGVSGWTQLQTGLTLPQLFDITIESGQTRYYRVRVVNQAGVPGPWSAPMLAMPVDPNVPGVSISETELTIEEGETAEYTVRLQARPLSNVTVDIDGQGVVSPNPSRLTFTPSNYNTPQTVELTALQDNDPDNEEIEVTHSTTTSDGAYNRLTVAPVAVTVIDDDSGVSVSTDQESVNEGETITFTLTRTGNTDGAITVDLFVDQRGGFLPADQLGARSEIMGAGVATATVTVRTDNDTVLESNGSVTLEVERGTGYLVVAPSFATVDVADDDGPPGQPVSLAAEDLDERVRLTWSAAPSPSSAIENYSYRVRETNGGSWDPDWTVIQFSGIGTTEHTVTGLTNGTDYTIQVRARNASGDGAAAEVTANPKAEPDRPDVTVSSRSEALLVTWTVPNDGGRDVTQYQVQWKSGSEAFDSSRQAAPTTPEHTIPSLTNGTEYGVRVRAMNEVGWGDWSFEQRGTPTPRPPTSLRITTDAEDGVSEPFRVTFTFTDEDHDGTQYVVEGFDVDDVEARYGAPSHYEVTLADFRVEKAGLVYSALVDEILDGRLRIDVPAGAAQSTHDGQQSTSAALRIDVEAPEAVVPTGTEIWSVDMTVGDYDGNAVGYIDPDRSQWSLNDTIGNLAGDDGNEFTYAGTNYTVGELSYVSAWNMVMFILCPGLEAADATFDLYLDDTVDGRRDHTLNFDPDEVESGEFNNGSCVEYRWSPRRVDWQEDGNVNVRLVR